jgi:hypothetical protein
MMNAPSSLPDIDQLAPASPRTSPQRRQGNALLALWAGRKACPLKPRGGRLFICRGLARAAWDVAAAWS